MAILEKAYVKAVTAGIPVSDIMARMDRLRFEAGNDSVLDGMIRGAALIAAAYLFSPKVRSGQGTPGELGLATGIGAAAGAVIDYVW